MGATNATTNLELSQFIGSDSPKWLTDYNGDMEKIDAGYGVVKAQADATDLVVSGHTSSISSLTTTTGEQTTSITNLRTDVNTNTGSINTINSLIGNGTPTTTDQTIIGAINELDSDYTQLNSKVDLIKKVSIGTISVTSDGVKTRGELIAEAVAAYGTHIAAMETGVISIPLASNLMGTTVNLEHIVKDNTSDGNVQGGYTIISTDGTKTRLFYMNSSNSHYDQVDTVIADGSITKTDMSSYVPSSDITYSIRYIDIE